jgi:hypothetical protein
VSLSVVAGVALISCGRRAQDPCATAYFNERACQDAVASGGYYWNGTWYAMRYDHPYPFYFDSYRTYRDNGGRTSAAPGITYGRPSSGSVERGGFGSTGEGHSSVSGHGSAGE